MKTSPFLATSAMMLATLAVQEDCGVNRFANNSSIPLPCIFSLVSVSERKKGGASMKFCNANMNYLNKNNYSRTLLIYNKSWFARPQTVYINGLCYIRGLHPASIFRTHYNTILPTSSQTTVGAFLLCLSLSVSFISLEQECFFLHPL